jgi:chromosome segregation ATPase
MRFIDNQIQLLEKQVAHSKTAGEDKRHIAEMKTWSQKRPFVRKLDALLKEIKLDEQDLQDMDQNRESTEEEMKRLKEDEKGFSNKLAAIDKDLDAIREKFQPLFDKREGLQKRLRELKDQRNEVANVREKKRQVAHQEAQRKRNDAVERQKKTKRSQKNS